MSWKRSIPVACLWLAAAGVSQAQSPVAREEAWLMQNYRFTGPPAPGSIRPTDPTLSELQRIQDSTLLIMHRARIYEDYETALAAAAQATANQQVIAAAKESQEAMSAARAFAEAVRPDAPPSATYLIALKDHTVETATNYWTDGRMLHYMTKQGAHVQVRLDLVDLDLSVKLNREMNLNFHPMK
jgi:hypothetical protein